MDTFPMSASDARIAAREDEYADYLACLQLAAAEQPRLHFPDGIGSPETSTYTR